MRSIENELALFDIRDQLTELESELALLDARTARLAEQVVVHALEVECAVAAFTEVPPTEHQDDEV